MLFVKSVMRHVIKMKDVQVELQMIVLNVMMITILTQFQVQMINNVLQAVQVTYYTNKKQNNV